MSNDSRRLSVPVTFLEIQTMVSATGAGLWLGLAQSFEHSTGPVYHYMRAAGEWVWTSALLLGVFLAFVGVAASLLRVRQLGLIVISLVWLLMTICFVAGNPHAFTTWTYFVLSLSAGYASLRLKP